MARLRFVLGLIVAAGALLLIALTGGGWLALDRLDPLLAVPGAGMAAMLGAIVAGQMRWWVALLWGVLAGLTMTAAAWAPSMNVRPSANSLHGLMFSGVAVIAAALLAALLVHIGQIARLKGWQAIAAITITTLIVGAAWQAWAWTWIPPLYARPAADMRVLMISGIPMIDPTGQSPPESIVTRLQNDVRLNIRDELTAEDLAQTDTLMLIQPRVLPPRSLVMIDQWVRDGGRAVILADALLVWQPRWPLGDRRNPPVTSLLTPLLSHWSLTLDAPPGLRAALVESAWSDTRLSLLAPGRFNASAHQSNGTSCQTKFGGTVAECTLGRGRAVLVSDADFLAAPLWQSTPASHGEASTRADNADWLIRQLGDPGIRRASPVWWHCNDCTR